METLILGRWHDVASGSGLFIVESHDYDALAAGMVHWSEFGNWKITPVLDDDGARKVFFESSRR